MELRCSPRRRAASMWWRSQRQWPTSWQCEPPSGEYACQKNLGESTESSSLNCSCLFSSGRLHIRFACSPPRRRCAATKTRDQHRNWGTTWAAGSSLRAPRGQWSATERCPRDHWHSSGTRRAATHRRHAASQPPRQMWLSSWLWEGDAASVFCAARTKERGFIPWSLPHGKHKGTLTISSFKRNPLWNKRKWRQTKSLTGAKMTRTVQPAKKMPPFKLYLCCCSNYIQYFRVRGSANLWDQSLFF